GSTVSAAGTVTIAGDCGDLDPAVGADIFIGGVVNNGGLAQVLGGADNDRITVLRKGTGNMVLDGRGGGGFYFVQIGELDGDILISDTVGGTDQAVVNGTAAPETFEVNRLVPNRVSVGTDNVDFTNTLETMTVEGLEGNDVFNVSPALFTT